MTVELITMGLGLVAAAMTSLSYIPQVQKALPRGSTHDLSFKTLCVLTLGLGLWCVYGLFRGDFILVTSNAVGAALAGAVLGCKLRDMRGKV
jgi:MtN3 and saliva related transmembrane protein